MRAWCGLLAAAAVGLGLSLCAEDKEPVGLVAPKKAADLMTSTLAEALADWIAFVEKDAPDAAARWAANQDAAKQMKDQWDRIKGSHKTYNYRRWIAGEGEGKGNAPKDLAKDIGGKAKFKVGEHDYGHFHIDWEKTGNGWRIVKLWGCR